MTVANGIPGVEVREGTDGPRPIQTVGMSALAVVGMFGRGPLNTPTLVTNETELSALIGDDVAYSYAPRVCRGFLRNGGGQLWVTRVAGTSAKKATLTLMDRAATPLATIRVDALNEGTWGNGVTVQVKDGSRNPASEFALVFRLGSQVETYDNLSMDIGALNYFATVINQGNDTVAKSKLVRVTDLTSATAAPNNRPAVLAATPLATGDDGLAVTDADYLGSTLADGTRTGLVATEPVRDIAMVAIPGVTSDSVVNGLLTHAANNGRFALIDTPVGLSPQDAVAYREGFDSSYGVMYYPWIRPVLATKFYPPSVHVAGVWARVESQRGVYKAPANEILQDVEALEYTVDQQQSVLNPIGINAIQAWPGEGIRVWGARTMSSDPKWRYIHKRRTYLQIARSVEAGTRWAVFEPNDSVLWDQISRAVDAYLRGLKAPRGRTLVDYIVQCDAETNPPEQVDLGIVKTKIGLLMPGVAEWVVYEISQWQGGSSVQQVAGA